jgi:hypothetical protein
VKNLIDDYLKWLREKIVINPVGEWYEITTPFLNRHNDYIQIYAQKESNDRIILTDGADTLNDLELSGFNLHSSRRKKELEIILNGFGVSLYGKKLVAVSDRRSFPEKKHNLIQAVLAIDDLYIMTEPKVISFFFGDVEKFLLSNDVRFSKNVILQGVSSFHHKFDLLIPASKELPERIVKVVNSPRKQTITSLIFSFEDTKKVRANEGIVIINDLEKPIPSEVTGALQEYNIFQYSWRNKDELKSKLVH